MLVPLLTSKEHEFLPIDNGFAEPSAFGEGDYLKEGILEIIESQPSISYFPTVRRVVQVGIILLAIGAETPYFPVSLRLPIGQDLAFACAIANILAFTHLACWASNTLVHTVLGEKRHHERILQNRNGTGFKQQIAIIGTAFAIALLSRIPVALPAFEYDGSFAVIGFCAALIGGALIPCRSLQLSFIHASRLRSQLAGDGEKKIAAAQSRLFLLFHGTRKHFIETLTEQKRIQLMGLLTASKRMDQRSAKILSYISVLLSASSEYQLRTYQNHSYSDSCAKILGVGLALSHQTAWTMYTWAQTKKHLLDNDVLAGFFASSSCVAGLYLTGASIIKTTHRVAHTLFESIRCRKSRSLSEQLQPKLSLFLQALSVLINSAATAGPAFVIWREFYEHYGRATQIYFESSMFIATFLFLLTATFDIIDELMEDVIILKGEKNKKDAVVFSRELNAIEKIVEESSLFDFCIFILKLPEDIKGPLIRKIGADLQDLQDYYKKIMACESENRRSADVSLQ